MHLERDDDSHGLAAGWAALRLKLLGSQLEGGRHATRHAGGEADVYV
jgi:hypothetical protein